MERYWKRGSEEFLLPESLPEGLTDASIYAVYEVEQGKGTARCYFADTISKECTKEQLELGKRELSRQLGRIQLRMEQEKTAQTGQAFFSTEVSGE